MLCRARKVKCNERWPTCSNCERLKLECPGPPSAGSGTRPRPRRMGDCDVKFTQAGTKRQRVAKSCQACRDAKARCSSGPVCTRCTIKGFECASTAAVQQSRGERRKRPSQDWSARTEGATVTSKRRLSTHDPTTSLSPPAIASSLAW